MLFGSLCTITVVDSRPDDSDQDYSSALEAARLDWDAMARRLEETRARVQATMDRVMNGRSQREMLRDSAFARLQARLDSMPVIEQAKGIVMARKSCGPDEAFDLLRRASQRANVKVSVLATQIVQQIASPQDDDDAHGAQSR
ncbi:MAG TPA: ANTAR domain-containing protein [Streptosporangiaceae bacterium]|nr:ANTAR domain-containing protein [Streptosporangiaceae bacterium]